MSVVLENKEIYFDLYRQWLHSRNDAALKVQTWFRAIRGRQWYNKFCKGLIAFQALSRGYLLRRRTLPELKNRLPLALRDKTEVCSIYKGLRNMPTYLRDTKHGRNVFYTQTPLCRQSNGTRRRPIKRFYLFFLVLG